MDIRTARRRAHKALDEIWKNQYMTRGEVYEWLSQAMKLKPSLAHVSKMNHEQCKRVIDLCDALWREEWDGRKMQCME